ncbi:MAG: hypothetical protein HOE98_23610 [Rhodospirillaceae bacterium]|nr:hypothetical protein [Rhodospirillaceae bacterium]MBT3491148.1 hypothetical protein [Rhodospirillaceae bacterium]MBT3781229.1 hypothetical protein [Rhodospirillaceae bacterium]MBT3979451.1 hypothetical protein [Rhodospirillaceae bacterium]MBT4167946.1 hypothetical protein [Rhodospirillaceae bacterium]
MAIEKIIDHLPFLDGSGRRRFVAGGIILIGVAVQNSAIFQEIVKTQKLDIAVILGSPVIAGGAILLVYAIGSLAEMLGELSLVRAASGIFLALQFPGKIVTWEALPERHWFYGFLMVVIKILLFATVVPFMVLYLSAAGFIGYTKFTIDIRRRASAEAWVVYRSLPKAAKRGLHEPVGNDTDFAQKYIVDLFANEPDRKWARRLIIRAKDVAATITALQVVVLYTLLSSGFGLGNAGLIDSKSAQLTLEKEAVVAAADKLEMLNRNLQRVLFLDDIRSTVRSGGELYFRDFPSSRIAILQARQNELEKGLKRNDEEILALTVERREIDHSSQTKAKIKSRSKAVPEQGLLNMEKERRVTQIDERLVTLKKNRDRLKRRPDNKALLEAVSQGKVASGITKLQNEMSNYRDYLWEEQERQFLRNMLLVAAWLFFLPLYLGYFTTLRNAITAILEAVAVADNGAEPNDTAASDTT